MYIPIFSVPRSGSNLIASLLEQKFCLNSFSHNALKYLNLSHLDQLRPDLVFPSLYLGNSQKLGKLFLVDKIHYRDDDKFNHYNYSLDYCMKGNYGLVPTRNPIAILLSAHKYASKNPNHKSWKLCKKNIEYIVQTKIFPQMQSLRSTNCIHFDWLAYNKDEHILDELANSLSFQPRTCAHPFYQFESILTEDLLHKAQINLSSQSNHDTYHDFNSIHISLFRAHLAKKVFLFNDIPLIGYGGFNPADSINPSRVALLFNRDNKMINYITSFLENYFHPKLLIKLRNNEVLSRNDYANLFTRSATMRIAAKNLARSIIK